MFGQEMKFTTPVTLSNLHVDSIVEPSLTEATSFHVAFNFGSTESILWLSSEVQRVFAGRDGCNYPLFGLGEVGNYRVYNPISTALNSAVGTITYLQAYTPLIKALPSNLFKECPFLITYLLGLRLIEKDTL